MKISIVSLEYSKSLLVTMIEPQFTSVKSKDANPITIIHIQNGNVLDVVKHTNAGRYPKQNIVVLNIEGYVYLVPYVKERGVRFLKTIIPSRKATDVYLGGRK